MRIKLALLSCAYLLTNSPSGQPSIPKTAPSPIFSESARWIWDGGPEKPVDCYRLFRKTFTVEKKSRKALLKITADAEYRLFVNGEYVGRGPAPNPPAHKSV